MASAELTIDLASHRAHTVRGEARLTPTEWHVVEVLVRNSGRLVRSRDLLQQVWGPEYGEETNYLRVHMAHIGHALVGDKIYGPDARLYLQFIEGGWTPALAERLLLPRQALHCARIDLSPARWTQEFVAPWPEDLRRFCTERGLG